MAKKTKQNQDLTNSTSRSANLNTNTMNKGGRNGNKAPYRGYTRGKSKNDQNKRRAEECADDAAAMSRVNDSAWYMKYTAFARDAATLPFSSPLGKTYQWDVNNSIPFSIPGLMRLRFTPTIGISKDYTSPINRSSVNFKSYLRSIQKASADYDHQDITMMVLAIDSCLMFHSLMRRIYGTLNLFTPVNRYYPRAILASAGVQFDDFTKHIADLRAYINSFAYRLGQYAVPKDIALFQRHQWMCEGLYTDSSATKAQTYMFVPQGFWQYDNTVPTGSQLVWKDWLGSELSSNQHTFAELTAFGDSLLNAISNDEDFAVISGDLYTFYNGNVLVLPETGETYSILPAFNETVLSQIENAMIAGFWDPAYTPVIAQNPNVNAGAIVFTPAFSTTSSTGSELLESAQRLFMNFHWDSPTPDQVMEASRLMFVGIPSAAGTLPIAACGTEIVNSCDIFEVNPATQAFRFLSIAENDLLLSTSNMNNIIQRMGLLAQFDWAPRVTVFSKRVDADLYDYRGMTWDADNFSNIEKDQLSNLHEAALYSLFNSTQVGARDRANSGSKKG